MNNEITVTKVPIEESWDCDHCGLAPVFAYLSDEDGDQTFGYCKGCLPGAIMADLGL